MASWMKARVNENGESFGKVLEVLGKTPVSAEPGESALDHPSTGQDDETLDLWDRLTISVRVLSAMGGPSLRIH
jgi:hypothetical protein